ncbi:MAG: class I SAM-dependent methyltransferase [Gammaproteobacteria bacterium]
MSFYEDHVFPLFLDVATRPFRRDRERLVARASGRVLEIGAGNGANLPCYTPAATDIVLLEPSRAMLAEAQQRSHKLHDPGRFSFVVGGAEALPFPDQSFDTVIACLVFCTIPDVENSAREAFRVLKPGGQFLFFEHVAHPRENVRRWQERVNPLWKKLACGCQLNRDTAATFRDAGFRFVEFEAFEHPKVPALANAIIRGSATR